MVPEISFADYLEIRGVAFDWVESYDTKDWERCKRTLSSSVDLDFRALRGELKKGLTPDEYVAIIADMKVIGDPRLRTQHLLGASQWNSLEDGKVEVLWQARVAHQRYSSEDMTEVINKGHGYGVSQQIYKKIDGKWKIVGIKPRLDWFEYDLFGTLNPEEH